MQALDDSELIRRYHQSGNGEIIALLMDRYQDLIIARTLNYLKDEGQTRDFISELYLKLSDKLRSGSEIRDFKSWLRRMITNALIDQGRRQKFYQNYVAAQREESEEIDRRIALEIDTTHLAAALEQLRPLPRLYVIQHFFMGKQNKEIAQEYGLGINQVRGARNRALTQLKTLLGQDFAAYFRD